MQKKKYVKVSAPIAGLIACGAFLAGLGLGWYLFGRQGISQQPTGEVPAITNEAAVVAGTISFSGVIIGVGADRLVVYVSQETGPGANVTVFVKPETTLQKTVAKTDQELAAETNYSEKIKNWDPSKGLPPPLDPVDNPYKTVSIKISDLTPDDVADFTAVGDLAAGQLTATSVTWTWHLDRSQPSLNR